MFASSRRTFATEASPLLLGRLDRKNAAVVAQRWLRSAEGLRYKNQTSAKFVGKQGTPFPMNPLFKPQPPLSDKTRQEIFDAYMKDPENESPLKLATKHSISIARVQAILRLKALQKQMEHDNQPIQVQLTHHMESLLRVDPAAQKRITEPLRILPSERLKPLFQFIDEADAISPDDAAKLLEKEPYANVQHKLDKQAHKLFSLEGPDVSVSANSKTVELERDPLSKSKFKFEFVDISRVEKQPVLIREPNGTLRTASKLEMYKKKTAKPAFFM
ncbi:hypothetical protein HDU98_012097 [Podochytrium sp. JEL0797]|nr:hypothetical protein HDU98_012097 [Podochytrium sp. JEL0797]